MASNNEFGVGKGEKLSQIMFGKYIYQKINCLKFEVNRLAFSFHSCHHLGEMRDNFWTLHRKKKKRIMSSPSFLFLLDFVYPSYSHIVKLFF